MYPTIRSLIPMLTLALCCGSSSGLTDAQINAAIQRTVPHNGLEVYSTIAKQTIRFNWSEWIYVLSASDRIAVAAYRAKQQHRPFSVQDARAMRLQIVAVVLEPSERTIKGVNHEYRVVLKVDDKIIQPLPGIPENYSLGVNQVSATFMFPMIERAQRLSVILIDGDGNRIEKNVQPRLAKLFESR